MMLNSVQFGGQMFQGLHKPIKNRGASDTHAHLLISRVQLLIWELVCLLCWRVYGNSVRMNDAHMWPGDANSLHALHRNVLQKRAVAGVDWCWRWQHAVRKPPFLLTAAAVAAGLHQMSVCFPASLCRLRNPTGGTDVDNGQRRSTHFFPTTVGNWQPRWLPRTASWTCHSCLAYHHTDAALARFHHLAIRQPSGFGETLWLFLPWDIVVVVKEEHSSYQANQTEDYSHGEVHWALTPIEGNVAYGHMPLNAHPNVWE